MYVAVKGGEAAIGNAHRLLAEKRRGDPAVPELTVEQIAEQLDARRRPRHGRGLALRPRARRARDQAGARRPDRGDLPLRAYRTTLPRFGSSVPVDTGAMAIERRISATFKDLPGGQVLGPTFDYTHRLLDSATGADAEPRRRGRRPPAEDEPRPARHRPPRPRRPDRAGRRRDRRRRSATSRASRWPSPPTATCACRRWRAATRASCSALGYSTQRGYGRTHPFVGEIRMGEVEVEFESPELGFAVALGAITVTECQMVNQFKGSAEAPPQFTRGYGLVFGHAERKAMAMALVDRALRARELGEELTRAGAGRGVRPLPLRQRRGDRLRRAPQAAALRRLPGRARAVAPAARRARGTRAGGAGDAGGRANDGADAATTSPISTSRPSG